MSERISDSLVVAGGLLERELKSGAVGEFST